MTAAAAREWLCRAWVPSSCPTSPARRYRGRPRLVVAGSRRAACQQYRRIETVRPDWNVSAAPNNTLPGETGSDELNRTQASEPSV